MHAGGKSRFCVKVMQLIYRVSVSQVLMILAWVTGLRCICTDSLCDDWQMKVTAYLHLTGSVAQCQCSCCVFSSAQTWFNKLLCSLPIILRQRDTKICQVTEMHYSSSLWQLAVIHSNSQESVNCLVRPSGVSTCGQSFSDADINLNPLFFRTLWSTRPAVTMAAGVRWCGRTGRAAGKNLAQGERPWFVVLECFRIFPVCSSLTPSSAWSEKLWS